MAEADKEAIYDAEIAPALAEVSNACARHGMSMVVAVEYERDAIGQTNCLQPMRGFWISLVDFAARARGNADTLILGLMRHARQHGHSSAIMVSLGVPTEPGGAEPEERRAHEERWLAWRKRPGETGTRYEAEARLGNRVVGEVASQEGGYAWRGTVHGGSGLAASLPEAKAAFETSLRVWLEAFRPFMDAPPPGYPGRDVHTGIARKGAEPSGRAAAPAPDASRDLTCLAMAELHGAAFARIVRETPGALVIDARTFPYFDLTDLGRDRAFRLMAEAPVRYLHAALDLKPVKTQAERWARRGAVGDALAAAAGDHAGPVLVLVNGSADVGVLEAALRGGPAGGVAWRVRGAEA